MCTIDGDSMASIVTSLSQSFHQVPPAAIPAMLDCILSSTGLSPSSVFDFLINAFPTLTENIMKEDVKLDSDHCNYLSSFVVAFCHLLKKLGATDGTLQLFIWKIFIPLVKIVHQVDRVMLNQIVESLFSVVTETDTWGIVEATTVPLFLNSVGLTMGMLQNEESNVIARGRHSYSSELRNGAEMDEEHMLSLSGSFPIPISCHILTFMLDAALRKVARTSGSMLTSGCYAEKFASNLLGNLCNMSEHLLLQSSEHRSCTIIFLLPIIFKAFVSQDSFEVSAHGETYVLSRNKFFMKIWKCCKILFSLGSVERRDAYNILSLYLSFFSNMESYEDAEISDGEEEFDIRAEKELWDELKGGLVDKEGLVRKQSLHILKTILCISQGSQSQSGVSEELHENSIPHSMTKRGQWAEKEAKSLGVGKICNSVKCDPHLNSQQQWEAFFLLYEMLEEYGTHLVEAAWSNQVTLLLQFDSQRGNSSFINGAIHQNQMENSAEIFSWLSILWERGLFHDNPQVRCLIMQSFLGIEWKNLGNCEKSVPESFLLGPFIQGLNDPVQHRDFGVKGVYSSVTIEGAANFLHQYTSCLTGRKGLVFLRNLASVAKQVSFGRAGLMALAECIASVACGVQAYKKTEAGWCFTPDDKTDLLDILRYVIESSKQHFNPNYRHRVCQKVLEAAASVVCTYDVPLEILLHFVATLPREFTDYGGLLKVKVQEWLFGCGKKHCSANWCGGEKQLLESLCDLPERFISCHNLVDASVTFDDEDVDAWEFEAKRWARVLFLAIKEEHHLIPIFTLIKNHCKDICKQNLDWIPVKLIILTLSLVLELQIIRERTAEHGVSFTTKTEVGLLDTVPLLSCSEASVIVEKFAKFLLLILEDLVSLASLSCSIFWSTAVLEPTILPGSIRGKLGGPSQRRLSSSTTTALLQAIMSMKAVASISSWCVQFIDHVCLTFAFSYMWEFFLKTISSRTCDSETGAEISLAAYEAVAPVLRALASSFCPLSLDFIRKHDQPLLKKVEGKPLLDSLVLLFLQNINDLLAVEILTRSRRAVLLNWKWLCLESLLSIPCSAVKNEVHLGNVDSFLSDETVRFIFFDLVESLENAGEGSVLTMLRSVRLSLELFASGRLCPAISSCNGVDAQMIWRLVHSSWVMHVSCNKRRVAPIAALLSSVLHSSVFSDEAMHATDGAPGPLKWFIENLLKEGTKSPRTIRLAALHLTGMWLSNPRTIKYYMEELKLLSLYGSVAFDEDFEAELTDNPDAKTEVSLLARSPDPELTEAFINTELYARVSVAVLFYKLAHLADTVGSIKEDFSAAIESGKLFLLELLDCAVNDKDVSKELYKKYSGVHRRKIRAWQMICILSQFVDEDTVEQVSHFLHLSLYRNNLPSVRQYLETFAVHLYLKFPSLVGEQLVPMLREYDMRAQALSSYVFIAANVVLHAPEAVQSRHLDVLLPPIIPLLTSHHHSLRGFTQLLVHNVLCKIFPISDSSLSGIMPLEKRCFEDLKAYLAQNSDCVRLRASMEGYLEAFDPEFLVSPAGIFVDRVEELEFECVPTSLMEQVLTFLNAVREELRCSMAKDVVTIRNESLRVDGSSICTEISSNANQEKLPTQQPSDISLDFQKKVIISKQGKQDIDSSSFLDDKESYKQLVEMEKEDQLLSNLLHHRSNAMETVRGSRQHIIIVASLIDRIPNLAGLARTCEVFKASGLAIADKSIVRDKQFQLISVTAEKWVPLIEVPVNSVKVFLEKKKREGFSILGLEQTANSITLDQYKFPQKTVLVLGREKEGIPVDIIHVLDSCIEIPQLGVVRSLNVHVSGAIALWEYTKQQRSL